LPDLIDRGARLAGFAGCATLLAIMPRALTVVA
jgi:hypothetical protein